MSPIAVPEKGFQEQVLQLAVLYRWRSFHAFDSRRSTAGFPDLVLVRGSELIFAELKTETGRTSPDQIGWLNDLMAVSSAVTLATPSASSPPPAVSVYLWRPSDLTAIISRLSRPAPVPPVAAAVA